jgi:hypothetical protein
MELRPTCLSQTPLNWPHWSLTRTWHHAQWCDGHRTPPVATTHVEWSLPVHAWPSRGDTSPISLPPHARSGLLRSPLPPAIRLAVEHYHRPPLPPLRRPKGPPSTPLRVATGCSPSHRSATLGAIVLRRRLPRGAHRQPPSPVNLQPNQESHELSLRPLLLTDPKFCSDSLFLTVSRPPRWAPLRQTGTNQVLRC